jgi:hypothetical protein
MLVLKEAITVRGTAGDPIDEEGVEDLRFVQLRFPKGVEPYALLGIDVIATGELSRATRGPEFAPVVMDVRSLGKAQR